MRYFFDEPAGGDVKLRHGCKFEGKTEFHTIKWVIQRVKEKKDF